MVPTGHRVAEVAPVFGTYEPIGASVHDVFPPVGVKVPAGHGVGVVAPVMLTNVPGGAGVHAVRPDAPL